MEHKNVLKVGSGPNTFKIVQFNLGENSQEQ